MSPLHNMTLLQPRIILGTLFRHIISFFLYIYVKLLWHNLQCKKRYINNSDLTWLLHLHCEKILPYNHTVSFIKSGARNTNNWWELRCTIHRIKLFVWLQTAMQIKAAVMCMSTDRASGGEQALPIMSLWELRKCLSRASDDNNIFF